MTNDIFFGTDALNGMLKGLEIGAKSVGITMGYNGKTVFIYKNGFPVEATKDGVTVINSLRLKDNLQDCGLKFIQDISSKTAADTGDGTSGVCVLMHEIISEGLKLKQSGVSPVDLKKGMDKASKSISETLKKIKKDVGNNKKILQQIATVSANSDSEIGDYIGGIYDKLGVNASIIVEDGNSSESTVELVNGFQFLGGYANQYCVNKPNNTAEIINPYILIIDGKVEKTSEVLPIIEFVAQEKRDIVIIADDFNNDFVGTFISNSTKKTGAPFRGYLIKQVFSGETKEELLLDLCAFTGATLITSKTGKKIEKIDTSFLGQCEKIVSKKDETTIFNGRNNKKGLALRIDDVNNKIKAATNLFLREKYEIRLAKLSGLVAIYYVGGNSNVEIGEKVARIDDAIRSTRCAIEEGVVPGGGTALIRCIEDMDSIQCETEYEKSGVRLIQKSIEKLLFQISSNAGKSGELIVEKVKEKSGNMGYNCKTNKIEDLFKAGVIDPAKVVRKIAENAISGAAQFIISECSITNSVNS